MTVTRFQPRGKCPELQETLIMSKGLRRDTSQYDLSYNRRSYQGDPIRINTANNGNLANSVMNLRGKGFPVCLLNAPELFSFLEY
ncbi:hypothetical protein NPIL_253071 [Nephila pilipes]|uniref:Uncharacterized protein n=1 Tax=Nephila pilipes TaxID=299642 RepID=A0A8X6TG37_NEPPI|nr:hypothetical protein NPIL_253071 [Nephila pilipes]